MIFKQWKQVLDGTKTQTRRLRFPHELAVQLWKHSWSLQRPYAPYTWADWQDNIGDEHVMEANCILTEQYITLPVRPHRTAKANGRMHPTQIRREQVQDISEEDAKAEGARIPGIVTANWSSFGSHIDGFELLWDSIHKKVGVRWQDNPEVWPLTFEPAE